MPKEGYRKGRRQAKVSHETKEEIEKPLTIDIVTDQSEQGSDYRLPAIEVADSEAEEVESLAHVSALAVDSDGNVYKLDYPAGTILHPTTINAEPNLPKDTSGAASDSKLIDKNDNPVAPSRSVPTAEEAIGLPGYTMALPTGELLNVGSLGVMGVAPDGEQPEFIQTPEISFAFASLLRVHEDEHMQDNKHESASAASSMGSAFGTTANSRSFTTTATAGPTGKHSSFPRSLFKNPGAVTTSSSGSHFNAQEGGNHNTNSGKKNQKAHMRGNGHKSANSSLVVSFMGSCGPATGSSHSFIARDPDEPCCSYAPDEPCSYTFNFFYQDPAEVTTPSSISDPDAAFGSQNGAHGRKKRKAKSGKKQKGRKK